MPEGIDPNLLNKWNKKLAEVGLPEELKPTNVRIPPASNKEVLAVLGPAIEPSLSEFVILPEKIQDDILADLKKQRELKMPSGEILNRFDVLVKKGHELEKMSSADSDRDYKPDPKREELERREIDEALARSVNTLIKKIERIRQKDNKNNKEVNKYKN